MDRITHGGLELLETRENCTFTFHVYTGERDTGFITIRPGGGGYVTLILLNGGQPTNFSLTANVVVTGTNVTDFFEYTLIPAIVFVESDSSTEVKVQINVSNNATDGLSVTFSVIAQSENNEVNNFITFDMVTTTAPPPKFKENVMAYLTCMAGIINHTYVLLYRNITLELMCH